MLKQLQVRDLAVVEEADIELGGGLTVVTGETGAGKSLLVDALLLLTGARADSALVRAGSERAELGAVFTLDDAPAAAAWLREQELDEDDSCTLRRVLKAEGSSRAWINGRPATLGQLGELGALLVEIHGQHEHQALLARPRQLALLDACLPDAAPREAVRVAARRWRELERERTRAGSDAERAARIELLEHELQQLDAAALPPAEVDALLAAHQRLGHADQLLEGSNALLERIDGNSEPTLRTLLVDAHADLDRLAGLDPALAAHLPLLDTALIQIEELDHALAQYASNLEAEPEQLAELDARMARLHALARRHQVGMHELQDKRDAIAAELETLQDGARRRARLDADLAAAAVQWRAAADVLSAARRAGGKRLGAEVTALMQELGMPAGRFEVALEPVPGPDPDPAGAEHCEFLVSANPGQPPRPLRKVASGGELSRISLALRVAISGGQRVGCMVFDEVDSGVGGGVAEVVGRKLRALGSQAQVLCVTHLPQVAAQGHAHLHVDKRSVRGGTRTRVRALDAQGREEEIARMLGGLEITPESEAHARQMLADARRD